MDDVTAARIFPGGIPEMIEQVSDAADAAMVHALLETPLETMKVRDRIAFAVRTRIEYFSPHRETARRTVGWLAMPQNAALGARLAGRTVDRMWRGIGDVSTDFNFYTKRALLLGVYGATFLYWLDDTSDGSDASWKFLDRRIADVLAVPKLGARARAALSGFLPRRQGGGYRNQPADK